ncbi:hypothetical protein, partial [Kribbella deserti]
TTNTTTNKPTTNRDNTDPTPNRAPASRPRHPILRAGLWSKPDIAIKLFCKVVRTVVLPVVAVRIPTTQARLHGHTDTARARRRTIACHSDPALTQSGANDSALAQLEPGL